MSIAGSSNIEYKKDEKTRYLEEDNVVDITKSDLQALQQSLNKDLKLDQEENLEDKLTEINDNVEYVFNGFLAEKGKRETPINLTVNGISINKTPNEIIVSGSKDERDALANYIIDLTGYEQALNQIKDAEIKAVIKEYTFELKDLRKDIAASTENDNKPRNVLLDNMGEGGTTNKERYKGTSDYVDPYKSFGYAKIPEKYEVENIFKDKHVEKVMESIFDNEQKKELHKGTFNINLGVEDGLAGIIIAIREAMTIGADADEESNVYKLYEYLSENNMLPDETTDDTGRDISSMKITTKQLKELLDKGLLNYDRAGGWDFEKAKIAHILSRAQWKDLDAFASLLQSNPDVAMAVKMWKNSLEITGQNREKTDHNKEQTSLIDSNNVLEFLCDINGDGQLSTEYKKKNNKEQQNQGDVGPIFGQQMFFTIEQAINVKTIELGEPQGEQLVIYNIIKNMSIADSRNLENTHLMTMKQDQTKCTKENLSKLINGSIEDGIYPMPEMKNLFIDAIKKINGGSSTIQPDLYNTLIGNDAEYLITQYEHEAALKTKIEDILRQSEDPTIQELIKSKGLVRVRETLFVKILSFLDNIEITLNDGTKTTTGAYGINKTREKNKIRNELLDTLVGNLIYGGIAITPTGSLTIALGIGKSGVSETGFTKWGRSLGSSVTLGTDGVFLEILGISGEIATQYNRKNVINADLSQVKNAKFVGVEGHVGFGVDFQGETAIGVIGSAGINLQKDPELGINQLDKQYTAVSEEIFDITGAPASTLADKGLFREYIINKIVKGKIDSVYGGFITANEQHLTDNLDFIVRYMDDNKFFGDNGLLKKYPKVNTTNAINALLDIIQSGNIAQRRNDVITSLHGKISLTKLSFGVTSSLFTFKSGKKTVQEPVPNAQVTAGGDVNPGDIGSGEMEDQVGAGLDTSKYGALFMYLGIRVSTWKNMYAPNVQQYLYTQDEINKGLNTEYIDNPTKNLDMYGKYLVALYNDQHNRLSYVVDNGRLVLTFDAEKGPNPDLTLAQFLNIHATPLSQGGFSLKGNVLTIGNVGDIGAYTITEAKGVRRILCLGSKKLDDAIRITGDNATTTVDEMKPVFKECKERSQDKIQQEVIKNMTGAGTNAEIVKTDTALFFGAEGQLIVPDIYKGKVTFEPAKLVGQKLKNGTLLITKNIDGTYKITHNAKNPIDKLTITYVDKKEYETAYKIFEANEKNWTTKEIASTTEIKNTFKVPNNLTDVFVEQTEKTLSLFDDHNETLYKEFMESIVDSGLDNFIDAKDYDTAFTNLKTILESHPAYPKLTELKSLIDTTKSGDEKIFIVDKFKTIFSYITYLTDGKNDGSNLQGLVNSRNIYKTMVGPNGYKYPITTDYRKTIVDTLKTQQQLKRTCVENLIGFTAFYKLDGKGRKYAMTPVGGTNVLTGSSLETSMATLNDTDKPLAQKWFIENLKVNADNQKIVVQKINTLLKKSNLTIEAKHLSDLLTGKTITLDSGEKISIDINRVFYLLGECANESLGMQINSIKIQKLNDNDDNGGDDTIINHLPGRYTATGTGEKIYTGGMDVSYKSDSITSNVIAEEEKVSIKGFSGRINKPQEPVPEATVTGGGDGGGNNGGDGGGGSGGGGGDSDGGSVGSGGNDGDVI